MLFSFRALSVVSSSCTFCFSLFEPHSMTMLLSWGQLQTLSAMLNSNWPTSSCISGIAACVYVTMQSWLCPPCRGICNCSFCRRDAGKASTGILIHLARHAGFDDCNSYLQRLVLLDFIYKVVLCEQCFFISNRIEQLSYYLKFRIESNSYRWSQKSPVVSTCVLVK